MGVCGSNMVYPIPPGGQNNLMVNGVTASDKTAPSRGQCEPLSAERLILARHERTLKARQFLPYDAHTMQKPEPTVHGQPYTDEAFPHVFEKDTEGKTINLVWKRPKDFAPDVKLFGKTINRYCAKQGQVGDCFFISTLSAIADHPEYIKQIFPDDAYETDPSKYTGIVHCRFWWMGEWIDVYTDDVLPCYDDRDRYVGVHSDDKNIVWVPLVEKALARLYGSYPQISGNQMDVFRLLTGGLVEDFKTSKTKKADGFLPPDKLFDRVDKALKSGSCVLTNISKETTASELKGLVPNHAYSVTGALKIKHKKQIAKILKIRNPWGKKEKTGRQVNDGEWKGRWSYTSTEWKEVEEVLRKRHNVYIDKGGEFWVCMEDFYKLFENVYVCDRIPNFDRDGFRKEDRLDKVINILGEWHGETAAGNVNKMRNPRFILTIPALNNAKDVAAVIEVTREFESLAKDNDDMFCMIGIYKIEKEEVRNNRLWMSVYELAVEKSDIGCRTATCLCKLSPGNHLLVPYYYNAKPPVSKSFCIRIFTSVNSTCRLQTEKPVIFVRKAVNSLTYREQSLDLGNVEIIFGEWVKKLTAGGQISHNSFGKNPQYGLSISGNAPQPVLIALLQETVQPIHAIGCHLIKIAEGQHLPVSLRLLHSSAEVKTLDGKTHPFMIYSEASGYYMLSPGQYVVLVFADRPKDEKKFALLIATQAQPFGQPK